MRDNSYELSERLVPTASSRLELLGGFAVIPVADPSHRLRLPLYPRRLLTLLAIAGVSSRPWLAGTLWPDVSEERAFGNLRTAVWQTKKVANDLIEVADQELCLAAVLEVDHRELHRAVRSALNGHAMSQMELALLRDAGELLPGWYDDWVIAAREETERLRVMALEMLAVRVLEIGRSAEALSLAMAAVSASPLRDSAHRLVVQAHLHQGNSADALRHFETYRNLLHRELHLSPSGQMMELIGSVLNASRNKLAHGSSPVLSNVGPGQNVSPGQGVGQGQWTDKNVRQLPRPRGVLDAGAQW